MFFDTDAPNGELQESSIFHLSQVLHYPSIDGGIQLQVLKLLRESLETSLQAQRIFKDFNGANSLLALPLNGQDSEFIHAWVSVIIAAIKGFDNYIDEEKLDSIVRINASSEMSIFLGCILAISMENHTLIETYRGFDNVNLSEIQDVKQLCSTIQGRLQERLCRSSSMLINPGILCHSLSVLKNHDTEILQYCVILSFFYIVSLNTKNYAAAHNSKLIQMLLIFYIEHEYDSNNKESGVLVEVKRQTDELLIKLIKRLVEKGFAASDLRYLLSKIDSLGSVSKSKQDTVMGLLHYGMNSFRVPPFIHFEAETDVSHGYLSLNDYERSFPPQSGYSLLAWIHFDNVDPKMDVPIMSIIDSDGSSRFKLLLNSKTLQLSLSTPKSTVSFQHIFETKVWYHIAIVHQKPRLSASTLKFYVNGKAQESLKCSFLGHPGSAQSVQTFIGSQGGSFYGKSSNSWSLGPMIFIEEILMDSESVLYMYQNSQESFGNWQGTGTELEPKKTVDEATENVPEFLAPITNLSSMVFTAPTLTDYIGIKEGKILFSLWSDLELSYVLQNYRYERNSPVLARSKSWLDKPRSILNLSKPKVSSLEGPDLISINGDLTCLHLESVYDGIWKLGGCAVLLRLIETSEV